jgi:hypothetical protein
VRTQAFAPFRPRRGRQVAWAVAVAAVAVFGTLALVLPGTYGGWATSDSVAMAAFGLLLAAAMWRFARIDAVPNEQGLVVRNVLVTTRVDWPRVRAVRFGRDDSWAWLDLTDGDDLAVMAIQRSDGAHARAEASRLAALVQAYGAGPAEPRGPRP